MLKWKRSKRGKKAQIAVWTFTDVLEAKEMFKGGMMLLPAKNRQGELYWRASNWAYYKIGGIFTFEEYLDYIDSESDT